MPKGPEDWLGRIGLGEVTLTSSAQSGANVRLPDHENLEWEEEAELWSPGPLRALC